MEQKILWDLHCFQCSLQFEKKSIYDLHLSLIHNYKSRNFDAIQIKSEPEEVESSNHSIQIQSKPMEEQVLIKKVVSTKEKKKLFKCVFCDKSFSKQSVIKRHVASVHERKKPFQCEACDYSSSQKFTLKTHIVSVHDKKKLFKCKICDYSSSQKGDMKRHVASVHEKKKPFKCRSCD